MAYTPSTQFPANINIGQWQTPDAPKPRLANPITSTDTTINVTAPFKDKDGVVITGNFLFGIKNREGYVETIYAPAASVSADGLTITGAVRGVRLAGYDYTTGDADLAADHQADSPVYANISALLFQMMIGAMTGAIASGGLNWKIGDGTDGNVTVTAYNADASKPFFQYNASTNQWVYSNDGVSSTPFGTGAGVTGGDGITVTAGDIDIDLTDTTVFKQTSAGAADAGKVPRLDANGLLDASFIDDADVSVSALGVTGVANAAITNQDVLQYDGTTRLARADADALNTTFVPAGIATSAAASAGDSLTFSPFGSIVTIPAFSLSNRANCRLWAGQTQATSNTTSDSINSTTAWRAQTFTPTTGQDNVGQVVINITNTSLSATMQCGIYATSGGVPTGAALGTATALTSFSSGDLTFAFATPVSVTPGTVYAIVIYLSAYGSGSFAWNYQNTDVYATGQRCTSANSGGTWTGDATADFRFTVSYRGIAGEPVYVSNTTGGLSLTPGTYNQIMGYAISTTQMMVQPRMKSIYATFTASITGTGTVDTEVSIGFRPSVVLVMAQVFVGSGGNTSYPIGIINWQNAATPNGFGVAISSVYPASPGAGANNSGAAASSLNLIHRNSSGTTISDFTISVQANGADTLTIRRVITTTTTGETLYIRFIAIQ